MYCPNCGKELPEGQRFCDGCGANVAAAAAQAPAQTEPVQQAPVQTEPQPVFAAQQPAQPQFNQAPQQPAQPQFSQAPQQPAQPQYNQPQQPAADKGGKKSSKLPVIIIAVVAVVAVAVILGIKFLGGGEDEPTTGTGTASIIFETTGESEENTTKKKKSDKETTGESSSEDETEPVQQGQDLRTETDKKGLTGFWTLKSYINNDAERIPANDSDVYAEVIIYNTGRLQFLSEIADEEYLDFNLGFIYGEGQLVEGCENEEWFATVDNSNPDKEIYFTLNGDTLLFIVYSFDADGNMVSQLEYEFVAGDEEKSYSVSRSRLGIMQQLLDTGTDCALIYIGKTNNFSYTGLMELLSDTGILQIYPFLGSFTIEDMVDCGGEDVCAVVASDNCEIKVNKVGPDYENGYKNKYSGQSDCLFVTFDSTAAFPDTAVSVSGSTIHFETKLGLDYTGCDMTHDYIENGSFLALPENGFGDWDEDVLDIYDLDDVDQAAAFAFVIDKGETDGLSISNLNRSFYTEWFCSLNGGIVDGCNVYRIFYNGDIVGYITDANEDNDYYYSPEISEDGPTCIYQFYLSAKGWAFNYDNCITIE